jgi:hypothetical protein
MGGLTQSYGRKTRLLEGPGRAVGTEACAAEWTILACEEERWQEEVVCRLG